MQILICPERELKHQRKFSRPRQEEQRDLIVGYLRPRDYYRGKPEELQREGKRKLAAARQRRKETNLKLRQPTLPQGC